VDGMGMDEGVLVTTADVARLEGKEGGRYDNVPIGLNSGSQGKDPWIKRHVPNSSKQNYLSYVFYLPYLMNIRTIIVVATLSSPNPPATKQGIPYKNPSKNPAEKKTMYTCRPS